MLPVVVGAMKSAVQLIESRVPTAIAVYLFGSMARDDATATSDVDLALLAPRPTAKETLWELREELAVLLRREVDVVDLRASSTVLRVRVLQDAQVLLDRDATARALFEATALSAYTRLNVERRHILADIRERGSVYG